MSMMKRTIAASVVATTAAGLLTACTTYREPVTVPAASTPVMVPSASPTTVVIPPSSTPTRVTYPQGAYELRGTGTPGNPYFWVWIPHGTQAPLLPPPPPLPATR